MTDPLDILKKIKPASDEECEKADYVVCARYTPELDAIFPDNFYGNCCECGEKILYRWHVPRKPKKICLECMTKRLEKESAS